MIALPEHAFSMERVHEAYLRCRQGKRGSLNTRDFEADLFRELRWLSKRVSDPVLLNLCRIFVEHNPTDSFVYKGDVPKIGVLPPHKTLFHEDRSCGIPIGNLTSQFFANVYLNELDQFLKRGLGVRYYLRYVDDFILLDSSPEKLLLLQEKIIFFLREKLLLQLKDPIVKPISVYKGIDFLGYFIKPRYTLVRRRVMKNLQKARQESLPADPKKEGDFLVEELPANMASYRGAQGRINSYLAHLKYANTFSYQKNLAQFLLKRQSLLKLEDGYLRLPKLDRFRSFRGQLQFFLNQNPSKLLLIRVGRRILLAGEEAKSIGLHLHLEKGKTGGEEFYFYMRRNQKMKRRVEAYIHKKSISYVYIDETNEMGETIKVRLPFRIHSLSRPVQLPLF